MEIVYIQAVLVDNGEIICDGKTLGYEHQGIGKYIYQEKEVDTINKQIIIKKLEK